MIKVYKYTKEGKLVEKYDSITKAADSVDKHESTIRAAIKRNTTCSGYLFTQKPKSKEQDTKEKAKILILDIETSPTEAYVWRMWKENISHKQVISNWFILSWSAKWLFDTEIHSDKVTPIEAIEENDYRIMQSMWDMIDEADIIIAHNAKKFDMSRLKTRAMFHGLNPTSPIQIIDTLEVARREGDFPHNSLDGLASFFGIENKVKVDFELWRKCKMGDKKALIEMENYNQKDVIILEQVYLCLRPYITRHPNLGLYTSMNTPVCPNCGSEDIKDAEGKHYYTPMNKYKVMRCQDCGAANPVRKSSLTKEDRENLIKSRAK